MKDISDIEAFAQAAVNGTGALFLGAGLSVSSGLPTWKELLSPFAKELSINLDSSSLSLYDVAQIYENEKGIALRDKVKAKINTLPNTNSSLDIITTLPCRSIWTTNYDCFIEDAFKKNGISPNVISSEKDLTSINPHKRINVFKLNGDINSFNNSAVITKVDFENYDRTHSLMLSFLKKELITHSFLFIGYSFNDNLILSSLASIRESLGGCKFMPRHYAIIKKQNNPEFTYVINNYEKNYNIRVIEISDYSEIPIILNLIKYYSDRNNIFISGSLHSKYVTKLEEVNRFCQSLALEISDNDYRIINGYGYKVGYYIACALTDEMIKKGYTSFQEKLSMYPFNEHSPKNEHTQHREFMISKANIAIFIYGYPDDDSGMIEEFKIAEEKGLAIIPVGATGGAAEKIYNIVRENIIKYPYLEKDIDILGNSEIDNHDCIKAIMHCVKNAISMQDKIHLFQVSKQ